MTFTMTDSVERLVKEKHWNVRWLVNYQICEPHGQMTEQVWTKVFDQVITIHNKISQGIRK
jgi:hypothetical protein